MFLWYFLQSLYFLIFLSIIRIKRLYGLFIFTKFVILTKEQVQQSIIITISISHHMMIIVSGLIIIANNLRYFLSNKNKKSHLSYKSESKLCSPLIITQILLTISYIFHYLESFTHIYTNNWALKATLKLSLICSTAMTVCIRRYQLNKRVFAFIIILLAANIYFTCILSGQSQSIMQMLYTYGYSLQTLVFVPLFLGFCDRSCLFTKINKIQSQWMLLYTLSRIVYYIECVNHPGMKTIIELLNILCQIFIAIILYLLLLCLHKIQQTKNQQKIDNNILNSGQHDIFT